MLVIPSEVCANNHYGSAKHRKREAYSKVCMFLFLFLPFPNSAPAPAPAPAPYNSVFVTIVQTYSSCCRRTPSFSMRRRRRSTSSPRRWASSYCVPTLLILTLAVLLQEEWSMKEPELRRELEEARSVLQSSGGSHGNNEEGSRAGWL